MPRVRKQSKRRRSAWTRWHVEQLLTGQAWFSDESFGCDAPFRSECDYTSMAAAWDDLQDNLLAQWIRERPGTRPYAWWMFDAPERRQRVDGGQHPFDRDGFPCRQLSYGVPRMVFAADSDAEYETEEQYLRRLDLLTSEEEKVLCQDQQV